MCLRWIDRWLLRHVRRIVRRGVMRLVARLRIRTGWVIRLAGCPGGRLRIATINRRLDWLSVHYGRVASLWIWRGVGNRLLIERRILLRLRLKMIFLGTGGGLSSGSLIRFGSGLFRRRPIVLSSHRWFLLPI